MAIEFVLIVAAIVFVVILIVASVVACCCCCRDNGVCSGFQYTRLPTYEKVEFVSLYCDDKKLTAKNTKQRNDEDTVIDHPNQVNKSSSLVVCAECSGTFDGTRDPECSFGNECRFKWYTVINLSDDVKREIVVGCSKASLDQDTYFKCKDIVITTLRTLLKHQSNDGLFSKIPDREGSTKTGLKIGKPEEFDFSVAVILQDTPKFVPRADIENERQYCQLDDCNEADIKKTPSGCTVIRLSQRDERRFHHCCVNGVLSPTKLLLYFKTFLSTAISHSDLDGVEVVVQTEMNGPAVRLVLQAKNLGISHSIDIDVAPKVVLSSNVDPKMFARGFEWPRNCTYQFLNEDGLTRVKEQGLYLIPKNLRYWCLSFANYENEVLKMFPNSSVEKKILRFMKAKLEAWQTQSKGEMDEISSYLMKEVFFWLRESMPDNNLWTRDQCAERYYNFVAEIRYYFANGHLPSYFVPTINLLEGKEKSRALMLQYLHEELKTFSGSTE